MVSRPVLSNFYNVGGKGVVRVSHILPETKVFYYFFSGGVDPITFIEANSTVCDSVMLLQDDNIEGPETLSLNLFSPTPAIPGFTPTTAIANITIQDINRKYQECDFEDV